MPRTIPVALSLFDTEFGAFDFGEIGGAFLLEFFVIQLEEQGALFHGVANVNGESVDLSVDLRTNRDLLGRANLTGGINSETNVAQLHRGNGGTTGRDRSWPTFLPVIPNRVSAEPSPEKGDKDNPFFHLTRSSSD